MSKDLLFLLLMCVMTGALIYVCHYVDTRNAEVYRRLEEQHEQVKAELDGMFAVVSDLVKTANRADNYARQFSNLYNKYNRELGVRVEELMDESEQSSN